MFSESELAFLAFLAFVSFFIVFLGCVMLGRGRIDSSAGRRLDVENKIKGVTCYHCRNNQHKKRRGPEENDDDEPYNRRSTLFSPLLLGRGNNTSTAKNTKKKRKGRKRATRRHCQDHQYRTRPGPDENDDHEPYYPRGTISRIV